MSVKNVAEKAEAQVNVPKKQASLLEEGREDRALVTGRAAVPTLNVIHAKQKSIAAGNRFSATGVAGPLDLVK